MQGGLLRVDGKVIAFTIGEPLTDDCFDLHFEKAFSAIQGAYPKINQVFAQKRLSGYRYINREEDMGIEGLRRQSFPTSSLFGGKILCRVEGRGMRTRIDKENAPKLQALWSRSLGTRRKQSPCF